MSTYSPKQLYIEFSNDYCDPYTFWGKRQLTWGKGAVYDIDGITKLLKLLPYPCMGVYQSQIRSSSSDEVKIKYGEFNLSGRGKLALPYKFLQILDPDAFKEVQQDPYASVVHALRNASDLTRACKIFWDSRTGIADEMFYKWQGRGAIEPTFHYAKNSLAKAILFNAPNFIIMSEAKSRGNGCGDMGCMPTLLTADYSCECPLELSCPPSPKSCKIPDECSRLSCERRAECAGESTPNIGDFRFPNSITYYGNGGIQSILADNWEELSESEKQRLIDNTKLIHAGYFIRKSYGGYGNFISHGDYYGSHDNTILLKYAQIQNGFNYETAEYDINISKKRIYKTKKNLPVEPPLNRIKNVTMVTTVDQVKDCLYNGYGILISTNVGFSDKRDSIGISYPDRLWYHTMSIIGYDDTKSLHPECLYLFANSWGNWNYGGQPDWGPIPEGSFLVTESHLRCMLNVWPRVDKFKDCNPLTLKRCFPYFMEYGAVDWFRPPASLGDLFAVDFKDRIDDRDQPARWARYTCNNVRVLHTSQKMCNQRLMDELRTSLNCGDSCITMGDCDYISCGANQSPWGMAFAISFDEDVPFFRKEMKYSQFYINPTKSISNCREALYNATVYLSACHYCDAAEFDVILGGLNIGHVNLNSSLATGGDCGGGYVLTEADPLIISQSVANSISITSSANGACTTTVKLECTLGGCHQSLSDIRIVGADGVELVPFYHIGDDIIDLEFYL
jgi:hypothetical protein